MFPARLFWSSAAGSTGRCLTVNARGNGSLEEQHGVLVGRSPTHPSAFSEAEAVPEDLGKKIVEVVATMIPRVIYFFRNRHDTDADSLSGSRHDKGHLKQDICRNDHHTISQRGSCEPAV